MGIRVSCEIAEHMKTFTNCKVTFKAKLASNKGQSPHFQAGACCRAAGLGGPRGPWLTCGLCGAVTPLGLPSQSSWDWDWLIPLCSRLCPHPPPTPAVLFILTPQPVHGFLALDTAFLSSQTFIGFLFSLLFKCAILWGFVCFELCDYHHDVIPKPFITPPQRNPIPISDPPTRPGPWQPLSRALGCRVPHLDFACKLNCPT